MILLVACWKWSQALEISHGKQLEVRKVWLVFLAAGSLRGPGPSTALELSGNRMEWRPGVGEWPSAHPRRYLTPKSQVGWTHVQNELEVLTRAVIHDQQTQTTGKQVGKIFCVEWEHHAEMTHFPFQSTQKELGVLPSTVRPSKHPTCHWECLGIEISSRLL
jgi:hypothetical protein